MSLPRKTRTKNGPCLEPLAVGIDSLYLSAFIDDLGVDWERLRFEKERLACAPGEGHAAIDFGGEQFALRRFGRKPYSFVLKSRAFELSLGERVQPRCHVQFGSELLWSEKLERAVNRFRTILGRVGTRETRPEVIARVDAAFDFAVPNPEFDSGHFVSRAEKDARWRENQRPQSFQHGKGDVVARVYDKVAEIEQQSGKHWLFDIWGAKENVWRCEFQIRGPRLTEAGIATVDQLRAYLPGLVSSLAMDHTLLRIPSRDSNRSRWPLHPMWKGLIASANRLVERPERVPPPLREGIEYPLDRQLASLEGDLKGVAALLSRNCRERPLTLVQLLKWLPRQMQRRHCPELWRADVIAKIRKRELGL